MKGCPKYGFIVLSTLAVDLENCWIFRQSECLNISVQETFSCKHARAVDRKDVLNMVVLA